MPVTPRAGTVTSRTSHSPAVTSNRRVPGAGTERERVAGPVLVAAVHDRPERRAAFVYRET